VQDIARAVAASAAYRVFVCNVATEPGETDQYSAQDFLAAVERHVDAQLFDAVITNTRLDASHPPYWRSDVVAAEWHARHEAELLTADVVDQDNAVRHDPHKLAHVIIQAWTRQGRGGRRQRRVERPPHDAEPTRVQPGRTGIAGAQAAVSGRRAHWLSPLTVGRRLLGEWGLRW
jgi:hypothetical protein